MANRYWIGGTGNWDGVGTVHWSATSGGSGGASVPTSADNVYFDANSFTANAIVTVTATANCLDMDWTGSTFTRSLNGTQALNIYGSLNMAGCSLTSHSGVKNFLATTTGKTITMAGTGINPNSSIVNFNGVGGEWTLQDNFTTVGTINLTNGSLNTNGKTVSCKIFNSNNSNVRSLTLGASTITCTDFSTPWTIATTTNLTFNAGTSTIITNTNGGVFSGGGLTYYNLTLSAASSTISGSNAFNTLTFTADKTVNLTAGTTQTCNFLVANGTPATLITIQSTSAGSAATITRTSGIQVIRNITLKDITATGGATFYALGTTNVSGNTGWLYQMLIKQEKLSGSLMSLYHIDSAGAMTKVSG